MPMLKKQWELNKKTAALTIDDKTTGCRVAQFSRDGNYTVEQQQNALIAVQAPAMLNLLIELRDMFTDNKTPEEFLAAMILRQDFAVKIHDTIEACSDCVPPIAQCSECYFVRLKSDKECKNCGCKKTT